MRLLIISETPHYRLPDGRVAGWGPTVREIDALAGMFDEVRHVAWFQDQSAPCSCLPYAATNVCLIPIVPTGGDHWRDKCRVLAHMPVYCRIIGAQLNWADWVHVRGPSNVSLAALLVLLIRHRPHQRWFKFAGDWNRDLSHRKVWALQRWVLRHNLVRGVITVNGEWPHQPAHIRSFFNPSLTPDDLKVGAQTAADKQLKAPVQLLSVGALRDDKGTGIAIRVLAALRAAGQDAHLTLVGDGPDRPAYERLRDSLGLTRHLHFAGWVPHTELAPYYSQAHLLLFPSKTEGWPKVVSEAMAYGVVPVTSDISCIKQYLTRFGCGQALPPTDVLGFARTLLEYCLHPDRWAAESQRGVEAAKQFTYDEYLQKVKAEVMELGGKAEITKAES